MDSYGNRFISGRGFLFGDQMKTIICPGCFKVCGTRTESGKFNADGPAGNIQGNFGDEIVSECCGDPVEEIDSDLFQWWLDLKKLAIDRCLEFLVADPNSHLEAFEEGYEVEDELGNLEKNYSL